MSAEMQRSNEQPGSPTPRAQMQEALERAGGRIGQLVECLEEGKGYHLLTRRGAAGAEAYRSNELLF